VAKLGELSGPVAGARAGFHAIQACWQVGDEFEKFGAWYFGAHQCRFACFINAMHGKDTLGEVDSSGYDEHDFPSRTS